MPYKDPQKRRQYDRERRRLKRAGVVTETVAGTGAQEKVSYPELPTAPSVQSVLEALTRQINAVMASPAETLAKARAVGYLAGVLLRGIETGDLAKRLEALEELVEEKEAQDPARGRA